MNAIKLQERSHSYGAFPFKTLHSPKLKIPYTTLTFSNTLIELSAMKNMVLENG